MASLAPATQAQAMPFGFGCEETEGGCEQATLLQVTGKSSNSLWPFPTLVEHAVQRGADVEQGRLAEVHKVHEDMESLALQKLAEKTEMEKARNLSDYNLTHKDFSLGNTTLTVLDSVLTEMSSLLAQIPPRG